VSVSSTEKGDLITATHPKMPFALHVHVSPHFATLYIDMGVPTDAMSVEDRMRLYRKLLHMNTSVNMVKTGLVDEEHRVVLLVDLDLESLNKAEFNDALTVLILATQGMIDTLGIADEVSEFMTERIAFLAARQMVEGKSDEEIRNFLVHRVGLDPEFADQFLREIREALRAEEERPESVYIQ
jgi:hypothetical protein